MANRSIYKGLLGSAVLLLSNHTVAQSLVNGLYAGGIAGASFMPSMQISTNAIPPAQGLTSSTINYSVGGGGGLQLGYRYEQYRAELQALVNYNSASKLKMGNIVLPKNKASTANGTSIKGDSMLYAGFMNAFFDFKRSSQASYPLAPYIGLGLGAGKVSIDVDYWADTNGDTTPDTKLGNAVKSSSTEGLGQIILGLQVGLDSYTSVALDGRYIGSASKLSSNGSRYEAGMINLVFNAAFDGDRRER